MTTILSPGSYTGSSPDNSSFAPSTWDCSKTLEWTAYVLSILQMVTSRNLDSDFERFLWKLKRRDLTSSSEWAARTATLFSRYLKAAEDSTKVVDILLLFKKMIQVLTDARPIEIVVGNVGRRILHIIRHESVMSNVGDSDTDHDLVEVTQSLLNPVYHGENTYRDVTIGLIAEHVIEEIRELESEIGETNNQVGDQASHHIFPNEVLLTFGFSQTVLAFLKSGRSHRPFKVYVAESAPSLSGRSFAVELAKNGIDVTLIPDSDVFAIMPVVTKVIIGAHAILANGGVITMIGANNLCLAAQSSRAPILVLGGTHKVSPLYAFDQDTFNEQNSPAQVLPFDNAFEGHVDVINPGYDYVAPEKITLFITDAGAHPPSYIYRHLSQLYSSEDYASQ